MRDYHSMMGNINELAKRFEIIAKKFENTEEQVIETARASYLGQKKP